jgi:hypothetical protein
MKSRRTQDTSHSLPPQRLAKVGVVKRDLTPKIHHVDVGHFREKLLRSTMTPVSNRVEVT